jgi:hypothetical protein
MRHLHWMTLLALGLSPTMALAKMDPLCAPILAFVTSVEPDDAERTLKFRTSWGSNFKDEQGDAIYAKRCEPGDYAAAIAACKALMEHGSVEFSRETFHRVLACLSPRTRLGDGVELHSGVLSLTHGTDDHGNHVELAFDEDDKVGGMVLVVTTDGY